MRHYIHYLRREVVSFDYRNKSHPWFARNQPDDQGLDAPCYHLTRATSGPAARIAEGDTIWLFSQLFTPWGALPPALDARVNVRSVSAGLGTQDGFYYEAGRGSRWFPLRNAADCIQQLSTRSRSGDNRPVLARPNQPVGQALRRLRELESATLLDDWVRQIESMPVDFISYRLVDGTRMAYEKVSQLLNKGRAVFWDRWSLPRRLAERRETIRDSALDAHIFRHLSGCGTVWGIRSPLYAEEGSYSAREMAVAQSLGKLRMYPEEAFE